MTTTTKTAVNIQELRAGEQPLPIAFLHWRYELYAILQNADPQRENGLLSPFLTNAEYTRVTGAQPPAAPTPPQELAGNAAAATTALNTREYVVHLEYLHLVKAHQLAIHRALPRPIQTQFVNEFGITILGTPAEQLIATAAAIGTPTERELETYRLQAYRPFSVSAEDGSLANTFARMELFARIMGQLGQPMGGREKFTSAMAVFSNVGIFDVSIRSFLTANVRIEDKTYATFKTHMLLQGPLDLANISMAGGYANATTTTAPEWALTRIRELEERVGKKDKEKCYDHWCWTHGPNLTHNSGDCRIPKEGHQNTATSKNKQGGATQPTRHSKKRN